MAEVPVIYKFSREVTVGKKCREVWQTLTSDRSMNTQSTETSKLKIFRGLIFEFENR